MQHTVNKKDYINQLAQKFIENNCTEEEMNEFVDLLESGQPEVNRAIDIILKQKLDSGEHLLKMVDPGQTNQQIQTILTKAKAGTKTVRWHIPPLIYKAVAIITFVIVAILSLYIFNSDEIAETPLLTHTTVAGQKATITLNDGSTVRLNSESSLIFPERFDRNGSREVHLEGEAFFSVMPDKSKPFIVNSKHLTTRVLGTSFNVKAYANENKVQVVVASGKVGVEDQKKNREILLTKNEMITYNISNQEMIKEKGDFGFLISWKDGTLEFDGIELREAARELERWFGIKITLENERLGNCLIKGRYKDKNLDKILRLFQYGRDDFSYEFGEQGVILRGTGCPKAEQIKL